MIESHGAVPSRWAVAMLGACGLLLAGPLRAQVPVRYAEGTVHGFLLLYGPDGRRLAQGDLLQTLTGDTVHARMRFRFDDGSLLDERVAFTQDSVFRMQRYALTQRGPSFSADLDATVNGRTGAWRVTSRGREEGDEEEVHADTLELPGDVVNGLAIIIAKNLQPQERRTVHFVAFTPKPQVIELEYAQAADIAVSLGNEERRTAHWVLKPDLGTLKNVLAKVTGQMPPDAHAWIVTDEVPAFVRFAGPLYVGGPAWRIDLSSPQWPDGAAASLR